MTMDGRVSLAKEGLFPLEIGRWMGNICRTGRPASMTQAHSNAASRLGNRQYSYGLVQGHVVISRKKKHSVLPSQPQRQFGLLANKRELTSYDPLSTCTNFLSNETHVASRSGETAEGTAWLS
jgi:hypothetical protein